MPAIVNVSAYKGSLPFGVALARGVLCNWLVCTAVYIAQGCRDLASKASIILLVITIFAALGFEHSVANMWWVFLMLLSYQWPAAVRACLHKLTPLSARPPQQQPHTGSGPSQP